MADAEKRNKPRNLMVKMLSKGCVVEVGCQSFAFDDPAVAGAEVARYLADPAGLEKEYTAKGWLIDGPMSAPQAERSLLPLGQRQMNPADPGTPEAVMEWR